MSLVKLKAGKRRQLHEELRRTRDARLYRRLLAVLECDRGRPIRTVAESLDVRRQSGYNWIVCFQECGDASALHEAAHLGRPAGAGESVDLLLQTRLMLSPERFRYHAAHWTVRLLRDPLRRNLEQDYSDDTIRRGLHRLGDV